MQLKYGVERYNANHNTITNITMIMKDRNDCMFTWISDMDPNSFFMSIMSLKGRPNET